MDDQEMPKPEPRYERWSGERISAAAGSDVGQDRDNNEDGFLMLSERGAWIVCDGMGGMAAGELATEIALAAAELVLSPDRISEGVAAGEAATRALLREAVAAADAAVKEKQREARRLRGMGCTLVAALYDGVRLHIVNLGDSRAYLISEGAMRLLSVDHTYAAELVRMGEITESEARHHRMRHQLTVAIGHMRQESAPDFACVTPRAGDRLLLCSDGLWEMVTDAEIARIVRESHDPEAAVERLIEAANAAGGDDNITAVLLACHVGGTASAIADETIRREITGAKGADEC